MGFRGVAGTVLVHSWAKSFSSMNIGGADSILYSEGVEDTL